jgi:hypothetical protein
MAKTNKKALDASFELEQEVGDDAEAYRMKDADVADLVDDVFCIHCDEALDAFGTCLNPDCESRESW